MIIIKKYAKKEKVTIDQLLDTSLPEEELNDDELPNEA